MDPTLQDLISKLKQLDALSMKDCRGLIANIVVMTRGFNHPDKRALCIIDMLICAIVATEQSGHSILPWQEAMENINSQLDTRPNTQN